MPRSARVVVPGVPHHVTQRGNRRERTFFRPDDYLAWLRFAAEAFDEARVEVWAYCLMPNHLHLVATPSDAEGLARAMRGVSLRYTLRVNEREGWTGHLWQGRFASFPMDEAHLVRCVRYVGLNPVRAGLVERAVDWPWSSVRAQIAGRDDPLVRTAPVAGRIACEPSAFFESDVGEEDLRGLRDATRMGRPLGAEDWLRQVEAASGRALSARPRGRPPKK